MDQTLLEYSRTHFATAQGSPFTVDHLSRLLNYDGLTTFGNRVLQGRVALNALPIDKATRALLQHMKDKTNPMCPRTHPLLYDELQNGIKNGQRKQLLRHPAVILASTNLYNAMYLHKKRRITSLQHKLPNSSKKAATYSFSYSILCRLLYSTPTR